jgi:triosephosphate isomerase (TIM)
MIKKKYTFVANWKMYNGIEKSVEFINENNDDLVELTKDAEIVICPSFAALCSVGEGVKQVSSVALGAQNCSLFDYGAYTGQECIETLKKLGCKYCIVGHSEVRKYLYEKDDIIVKKCIKLLSSGITPIMCIGESEIDFSSGKCLDAIKNQVEEILSFPAGSQVYFAYEPVWAIGTGKTPSVEHVEKVFAFLKDFLQNVSFTFKLLYGGSVDDSLVVEFKKCALLDGFLIGRASLDFQELKKIVECGN